MKLILGVKSLLNTARVFNYSTATTATTTTATTATTHLVLLVTISHMFFAARQDNV